MPCWGSTTTCPGDDEDAITLAVEAGRAALESGAAVERVVVVSRDLPLLESSNAAVLLAGLSWTPSRGHERLGGAPAAIDALSSARPRTLVIGVESIPRARAVLTADSWHGSRLGEGAPRPAVMAQARWSRSRLRGRGCAVTTPQH